MNMPHSLLSRIARKVKSRWEWRASRAKYSRVTFVTQFFSPDFAATGQLLNDLTKLLAKRDLQINVLTGMPAYAYSSNHAKRLEFSCNRCIRRTIASRFWPQRIRGRAINSLLFTIRSFTRMLRSSRRGDLIIYTSEPPFLPLAGWLLHLVTRTPFITILYDLYPDILIEIGALSSRNILIRIWKRINKWMLRDAQEIIVLSDAMADKIKQSLPKEDHQKISIIPSWADPNIIKPIPKSMNWFAKKHKLENKFVVLYSGNQGRCHDLVTCLASASILRNEKDILFLFIGNGPQNHRLTELVEDWGLNNCQFLPYQELEDLPFSLSVADIALVTLSIKAEGLVAPSKLYAHLAASTPIAAITPPDSYLKKLVELERCGQWFNNGDSQGLAKWILDFKNNPEKYLSIGENGREYLLRTATPTLVTDKYVELIQKHI